ncbi:type VI secretion system protein TssA [Enterobacter kobei]
MVFSQPSAGAERSVQHHWGMDKRWDLLPESVGMLPTALRPVKPGIPWRRVLASAAALTMVSWAVWMSIAYVTNRNQIAGANAQASLAARENQSLEQRLHALSELQKTLARLQYRAEHGVPWYERAGLSQNDALLTALWPRYPEVVRIDAMRTTGALLLISQLIENEPDETRPELNTLYSALESRLQKAGGVDAVVPQNASTSETSSAASHSDAPAIGRITSGQDLLAQARTLTEYLREQPDGWLSAHHLMKSLRHDTLRAIPAPDAQGRTRIEPPRADQRALLKRLYLQQNWTEMLETADSTFSRGANHLWLDLQWYIHQALTKSGQETLADIIVADLKGLLTRLAGLETLAFSDGTPFADEVTLNWIQQSVLDTTGGWDNDTPSAPATAGNDDILALEPEAVALADSEGPDAALGWLQTRSGMITDRQRWLLRLLMGRIAEQYGKNDLAVHLFAELGERARVVTLSDWEPELLFEVQARHLKLLRLKAGRSEADKVPLNPLMEELLAGLIAIDPVRASVLCA